MQKEKRAVLNAYWKIIVSHDDCQINFQHFIWSRTLRELSAKKKAWTSLSLSGYVVKFGILYQNNVYYKSIMRFLNFKNSQTIVAISQQNFLL
jgi:hypothetical protein